MDTEFRCHAEEPKDIRMKRILTFRLFESKLSSIDLEGTLGWDILKDSGFIESDRTRESVIIINRTNGLSYKITDGGYLRNPNKKQGYLYRTPLENSASLYPVWPIAYIISTNYKYLLGKVGESRMEKYSKSFLEYWFKSVKIPDAYNEDLKKYILEDEFPMNLKLLLSESFVSILSNLESFSKENSIEFIREYFKTDIKNFYERNKISSFIDSFLIKYDEFLEHLMERLPIPEEYKRRIIDYSKENKITFRALTYDKIFTDLVYVVSECVKKNNPIKALEYFYGYIKTTKNKELNEYDKLVQFIYSLILPITYDEYEGEESSIDYHRNVQINWISVK